MKICTKCKIEQPKTDFVKDKTSPDGLTCWCKKCRNSHNATWRLNNKDKMKALNDKHKPTRKAYYSKPEVKLKYRVSYIENTFGIKYSVYEELLLKQNNVCAICKQPEKQIRNNYLAIDHCHTTGVVRGLLCSNCNRALGLFGDSTETLSSAISYLNNQKEL